MGLAVRRYPQMMENHMEKNVGNDKETLDS